MFLWIKIRCSTNRLVNILCLKSWFLSFLTSASLLPPPLPQTNFNLFVFAHLQCCLWYSAWHQCCCEEAESSLPEPNPRQEGLQRARSSQVRQPQKCESAFVSLSLLSLIRKAQDLLSHLLLVTIGMEIVTGWEDLLWAMQFSTMYGSVFGWALWGLGYQGEEVFLCCCTGLPSVSVSETRPCSVAFALFKPCAPKACLALGWFVGFTSVTSLYLNLLSLGKICIKYSV